MLTFSVQKLFLRHKTYKKRVRVAARGNVKTYAYKRGRKSKPLLPRALKTYRIKKAANVDRRLL